MGSSGIKATEPKIYKDQLQGVTRLLTGFPVLDPALVAALCDKPAMSFTRLRAYLEAYSAHPERCAEAPPSAPIECRIHGSVHRDLLSRDTPADALAVSIGRRHATAS